MHFKHGFALGKFLPPHRGHYYMIDTGISYCDHFTILLYSLPSEPISGSFRKKCIEEEYGNNPKVTIKWIEKDLPQEPSSENDEAFWKLWCDQVTEDIDGEFDAQFGSETYVTEMANRMGIFPFLVDMSRHNVSISGTLCRENAFKYWDYIPDPVKSLYVRSVAIMGVESAGKSTLTTLLSRKYNTIAVKEYGREYLEDNNMGTKEMTEDDYVKIATKHWMHVGKAKQIANKYVFSDTEILTTKAFYLMAHKEEPKKLNIVFQNKNEEGNYVMAESFRFDYYIVLQPQLNPHDDGTRVYLSPEQQQEHYNLILKLLDENNCNYIIIQPEHNIYEQIDPFINPYK